MFRPSSQSKYHRWHRNLEGVQSRLMADATSFHVKADNGANIVLFLELGEILHGLLSHSTRSQKTKEPEDSVDWFTWEA